MFKHRVIVGTGFCPWVNTGQPHLSHDYLHAASANDLSNFMPSGGLAGILEIFAKLELTNCLS